MALTKGQFILYENTTKMQAAFIKNGKRVETSDGTRYITEAVDNSGLLLASGNFANPLNTGALAPELSLSLARMAAGETIKVACYGDSTTDGNNTTGHSFNPTDASGNAIGTRTQNDFALNAFPARLQSILQEVFNNVNISTWNAGYSGKRMDDGWAVANYQSAVINTYGIPDVIFIAFGLNDIQEGGSQIDDHVAQTNILIERVISEGSTPVLLTGDAFYRNGDNSVRDHKESNRQINEAKIGIALKYGIQIIDMNAGLKSWIQNNSDGYNWLAEQDDGLHFGDKGHSLKASLITSLFFRDSVNFAEGDDVKYINTWDSAASYVGDYSARYLLSNNKQGGNVLYSNAAPQNTDMMDLLVWNESPNAHLIYLGIDSDLSTGATPPSVSVKNYVADSVTSKNLISAGGFNALYRRSDEQFIFGKLSYGLNRIKYTSGTSPALFYGGFKIAEGDFEADQNALSDNGRFRRGFTGNTGIHAIALGETTKMSNTVGGFDGDTISISLEAILPQNSGAILLSGQGFDGNVSAINNNLQTGVILFRRTDDSVGIYNISFTSDGVATFQLPALLTTSVLNWNNDKFTGRVEISRVSNNQLYKVFNKYRGGTTIGQTSVALTDSSRWSGFAGGVFYNSDANSSDASVEVVRMQINRDFIAAQIDPDVEATFGTAAYADLTTSSTDTTVGSVTRVGDFGIGSTTGIPVGAVSLDTLTEVGEYYYSNTATNAPNAGTYGTLSVRKLGSAAGYQIAHQTSNPAGTYTRELTGAGFGAWVKVLTDGNTNLNEFITNNIGERLLEGVAISTTEVDFPLPTPSFTYPTSITALGGYEIKDARSSAIVATGVLPALSPIATPNFTRVRFTVVGAVAGKRYLGTATSINSKITVNF